MSEASTWLRRGPGRWSHVESDWKLPNVECSWRERAHSVHGVNPWLFRQHFARQPPPCPSFHLLVFLFNVISVWVIWGQSIVQTIFWERHSHRRTQQNNFAANKSAALLTTANAGAQLALCNFYTTHYLSLDICWLNPKWNKCAFCFQLANKR